MNQVGAFTTLKKFDTIVIKNGLANYNHWVRTEVSWRFEKRLIAVNPHSLAFEVIGEDVAGGGVGGDIWFDVGG